MNPRKPDTKYFAILPYLAKNFLVSYSTMSTATDMLQKYLDAETAILSGQTVRFGERLLTRANLIEVQQGRREWERKVSAETRIVGGGSAIRFQTPDFS